jgi:hypothetical protein
VAPRNDEPRRAGSESPGAQQPLPEDVALEIDRLSRDDVWIGPAGAAVRAMLISAAIMGGAMWLARFFFKRERTGNYKRNG